VEGGELANPPITKYIGSQAVSQVYWKPEDLHLWIDLMAMEYSSSHMGRFVLRMAWKFDFGGISGSRMLLSEINILLSIWVVLY
jgi:hypothetical protein